MNTGFSILIHNLIVFSHNNYPLGHEKMKNKEGINLIGLRKLKGDGCFSFDIARLVANDQSNGKSDLFDLVSTILLFNYQLYAVVNFAYYEWK